MRWPKPSPGFARRSVLVICAVGPIVVTLSCSLDDPRRAQAEQALAGADAAIAEGKEVAGPIFKQGREAARPLVDDASAYTRSWLPDLPDSGELSEQAQTWISGAANDDDRVEYWLDKGEQAVPVARDIGRTLNDAVERDFVVEPIYRKVTTAGDGDVDLTAIDASIAAMPRVEVIDGLTVGFRRLAADDTEGREKQSAYLVLWRAEHHLVGFVFRSRRKIRLDKLVAEAPRLIALVRAAL